MFIFITSFIIIITTACFMRESLANGNLPNVKDSIETFYFSKTTAVSDPKKSRCVLNEPIKTYRSRNKILCLASCYRNPNCKGVNSWTTSGGLTCKEIGRQPFIYIVAPQFCTFYQLKAFQDELNSTKTAVNETLPSDLRKCGSGKAIKGSSSVGMCSFPFTFRGKLYHACSQLFQPDCQYYFCIKADKELLYCSNQSSQVVESTFVQVISGLTASVPSTPVQVINNWLVILQRLNGSISFDRNYKDYRDGFGEVTGSHWLGLSRLNILTSSYSNFRLRIEVQFADGSWVSDEYGTFRVGPEGGHFKLFAGRYSGDNGDVLKDYRLTGRPFQVKGTPRKDEDEEMEMNCTDEIDSGWWLGEDCEDSLNLNAPYDGQLRYPDYSTSNMRVISIVRMMMIPRVM